MAQEKQDNFDPLYSPQAPSASTGNYRSVADVSLNSKASILRSISEKFLRTSS